MPRFVQDPPIKEFYGQVITGVADPATTAANRRTLAVRRGFREILVRNADATAAEVLRWAFFPKIVHVFWYDDSATKDVDKWIDLLGDSKAMLDSAQTSISQFTLAAADRLYIATTDRHGGFLTTIDGTILNNNTATITGEYSTRSGFVATGITDGTTTGGATLGQNVAGNVIEIDTAPADGVWQPIVLNKVISSAPLLDGNKYYWFRIVPSTLLDAVEFEQITTLVRTIVNDTGNSEAAFFANNSEYTIDVSDWVGGIEYWVTEGAVTGHVTWIKR